MELTRTDLIVHQRNHNLTPNYPNNKNGATTSLEPVTDCEVMSAFSSLSNSNSCDAEGLQVDHIKYVLDIVASCLASVFNNCLSAGTFLQRMHASKVSAIDKKVDKKDLGNYHPMSIFSIFSKGLEKIVLSHLVNSFNKHHILTPSQYLLGQNCSTEHMLLTKGICFK